MIYLTGDTHGEYRRFSKESFPEQLHLTRNDYVIVLGDFGIWDKSPEQEYWFNWLSKKSFTILFIDGNHENYDLLNSYEVKEWNGGKVHFIKDNIIHLMRGQVFTIEDITFFTFGGARSHDIQDGILNRQDPNFKQKKKDLNRKGGFYRIEHETWWKEEMPNEKEFQEGLLNLKKYNNDVDFVLTHCASNTMQQMMNPQYKNDDLTQYFEGLEKQVKYKIWFFGHYHENLRLDNKHICLYEQITPLTFKK